MTHCKLLISPTSTRLHIQTLLLGLVFLCLTRLHVQCTPLQLVELASQRLAQGDATKAGELYTQALGADELHLPASLGVVESLLARGELEDAAMHLQLLPELVSAAKLASAPVGGECRLWPLCSLCLHGPWC